MIHWIRFSIEICSSTLDKKKLADNENEVDVEIENEEEDMDEYEVWMSRLVEM